MLFAEDKLIRLGGVTLPGLIKKLEVTGSARIEEQEVEGSAVKPKQAVGYDDVKISVELTVDNSPGEDAPEKLERIQRLFRSSGAQKPRPLALVCSDAATAGVDRVLLKDFKYTRSNRTAQYTVSLELWEYIPAVITAKKSSAPAPAVPLTDDYQKYLENRGSTPGKSTESPAQDKPRPDAWFNDYMKRW